MLSSVRKFPTCFIGMSDKVHTSTDDRVQDRWHRLYVLLDRMTDVTWGEIRKVLKEIEVFEEGLFEHDCDPRSVLKIKKKLGHIDYSLGHLASVVEQIKNFSHPHDDLKWKWRDLKDHCDRIYGSILLARSQVMSAVDLYWGYQTHKSNRHIKKLSSIASIAVPLTFLTSFFGMNFTVIPYQETWFFVLCLILMVVSVLIAFMILVQKGFWKDD
jgi:magnesium transporter